MKRELSEQSTSSNNNPPKIAKINKALPELLAEVSTGQYDDFRAWLVQTNCKRLDLNNGKANNVNLSHLGQALKGSAVTAVNLKSNRFNDQSIKEFGLTLKDTAITHVDLGCTGITSIGAKEFGLTLKESRVTWVNLGDNNLHRINEFGKTLKGTAVTHVDVGNNYLYYTGAKEFVQSLKGSAVKYVSLGFNNIFPGGDQELALAFKDTSITHIRLEGNGVSNQDAINLVKSLAGSNVTSLDLSRNFSVIGIAAELAEHIEKTNLLELNIELSLPEICEYLTPKIESSHPVITNALRKNQERILITPYEATRLWFLPYEQALSLLNNKPALNTESNPQEQIEFAAGILANLPLKLTKRIISFLPYMNTIKAENIIKKASIKNPILLENIENITETSERKNTIPGH